MEKKMKIGSFDVVVLDSGTNLKHPAMVRFCKQITGFSLKCKPNGTVQRSLGFEDQIGHGTAVCSIIAKNKSCPSICSIKIFFEDFSIDEDAFISILDWVYKNIEAKVLHLSCGICECFNKDMLQKICNSFVDRGTTIVAAFDNYGGISYPAAFSSVIGVDLSQRCSRVGQMIYVGDNIVNIRAMGTTQRLPWLEDRYEYVASSSFSAPHVTSQIIDILSQRDSCDDVLGELRKRCFVDLEKGSRTKNIEKNEKLFKMEKSIIFPFNKEIHSVLRFENYCNFSICGYYEHPYLLAKNRKIFNDILKGQNSNGKELQNARHICWTDEFDTVIIGHTKHLSHIVKTDLLMSFLKNCIKYNKNIISFDTLEPYQRELEEMRSRNLKYYFPHASQRLYPQNSFGKLPLIPIPVVCVCGTSKRQGKFTLQMKLREQMESSGFSVAHFSTEPSGILFRSTECFPMGYASNILTDPEAVISNVRWILSSIAETKPDLIITGTQSQTLPITFENAENIPYMNHLFINGALPDAFLLVVNIDDEISYVKNVIQYCNSVVEGEVLGIVISPLCQTGRWSIVSSEFERLSKDVLEQHRKKLKSLFDLPVFVFDEISNISELVIEHFK